MFAVHSIGVSTLKVKIQLVVYIHNSSGIVATTQSRSLTVMLRLLPVASTPGHGIATLI